MRRRNSSASREINLLPKGLKHKKTPKKKIVNVGSTRYSVISDVCRELNYEISYERDTLNWDLLWTDTVISIDYLSNMQQNQKINHFSGMANLSRKALLSKNLKRMQKAFPDSYSFFPFTFILPQDIFLLNKFQDKMKLKGQRPTFIIKPEVGCQGRGIYLWQDSIELQTKREIVQIYIERPLLYKGLKFDLRVYVLVTGCSPLRAYIFNEGLVRLATELYQRPNENNIQELKMHLTNYAINRQSPKYIFNDSQSDLSKGHKKSLAEFFVTLKAMGFPAHEYWTDIKDISIKTLISGLPWLKKEYQIAQPTNQENNMCFQILGLDFIIQQNHKVFLLEVNHTPSFHTDTPLDTLLKGHLIRDTIELVMKQNKLRKKVSQAQMQRKERKASEVTFSLIKDSPYLEVEENDALERKILGSFERIYPCPNEEKQQKYSSLMGYSLNSIEFEPQASRRRSLKTPSSVRRKTTSQTKHPSPVQDTYPRQKIRLSKVVKPQYLKMDSYRGVDHLFDRSTFRQQISRRNNQFRSHKARQLEQDYQTPRRQKQGNVELKDILAYHHNMQKYQKNASGEEQPSEVSERDDPKGSYY